MDYLFDKDKINWEKLDNCVKEADVLVPVPDAFIGFKKRKNLKESVEYFRESLQKLGTNHWINFFYDADFTEFKEEIKNPLFLDVELTKDISLFSTEGLLIDSFNLLKEEFSDEREEVDFNEVLDNGKNQLLSESNYRLESTFEIGKQAEEFLEHHVLGSYHLNPAAAPFTGVSFEYKTPSYRKYNYGYGRAFDFLTAKNIASLEAVERFASEFYAFNYKNLAKKSTYEELKTEYNVLPVSEIPLEANSKINNNTSLFWLKGQDIKKDKEIFIPEDLVYYGNYPSREGYMRRLNDSSNGVALGSNYTETMISALLELIERHSFLMTWYGKVPGKRLVDYDDLITDKERKVVDKIEKIGARVNLFEISVFKGVYVVWGLIMNDTDGAIITTYTSAGAGFTLSEAIRAALMEVAVGYLVQGNTHETTPDLPKKIQTMDDHIDFYANPLSRKEFDFIDRFPKYKIIKQEPNLLKICGTQEELVEHLLNVTLKGYKRIIFVNLTSKEMSSRGLYVVKAIIPEFLPMTFGDGNLRINLDYINKSRAELGLDKISSYSSRPHPFP